MDTEVGAPHDAREYDVVVSSGEQVTVGLLAIALQNIGVDARSWLGWQVAMHTDNIHGGARIEHIDAEKMSDRLKNGQVAVMAGFQGVAEDNRITTLGRGGVRYISSRLQQHSKLIGVISTQMDGIYTTDPRIVPKATKLDTITFEEMLELASAAPKSCKQDLLRWRCAIMLRFRCCLVLKICPGQWWSERKINMEKNSVSGIAYSADEAKITLAGLVDKPGIAATVFSSLADQNVNVDMIVQTAASTEGRTDITFSVSGGDVDRAQKVLEAIKEDIDYQNLLTSEVFVKFLLLVWQ